MLVHSAIIATRKKIVASNRRMRYFVKNSAPDIMIRTEEIIKATHNQRLERLLSLQKPQGRIAA